MRLRSILVLLFVLLLVGGYFYFTSVPKPLPSEDPRQYVWLVEDVDIQRIEIQLTKEGKGQSFVLLPDRTWHFDDPQLSPVDMQRWGGGIPLLLSGPGADRVIEWDATPEQLAEFGLAQPRMKIALTLKDESIIDVDVGDATPGGTAFYVRAPDTNAVATVDISWYDVISRLVTDPPYAANEAG
ncbi:MAG: DUF4340 domain-containing protein [Chloroflexi bacterium]|nr:DUF4340 domain-containing protein [Chloroflexota bacterium]